MKKSLLALAALTAFAGAASAQSSVTLYGRLDISFNKPIGTEAKGLANGSGSRLGVRGVEDLGGGLKATFNLEHRFDADTGNAQGGTQFWRGRSIVGLQGNFGQVVFGREYTTAFLQSQLTADPWGWDTIVNATPGAGLNQAITGGGIVRVRNDSSITYRIGGGGFTFGAQIAEATDTNVQFPERPVNFAVSYASGPIVLGLGYDKTGQRTSADAKWTTLNGSYNFGSFKLGAFYGTGNTATGSDHRSWMLTATAPIGAGEFRASYGKLENQTANVDAAKGFAFGYHYSLSKRTTVYADIARNTGAAVTTQQTGYDIGLKHNF